jgi:hypothetical protein
MESLTWQYKSEVIARATNKSFYCDRWVAYEYVRNSLVGIALGLEVKLVNAFKEK